MSQNNVKIVETLDFEQWKQTQIAPLPTKQLDDPMLQPTVSDELRWSLQTAVRPLEAGAQMCAGVHGITTNEPEKVEQHIEQVEQQLTNQRTFASKKDVEKISLDSQTVFAAINRINDITLEKMGAPLLRMYISQMAATHPAILQYMRDNNETFTYFKPVSETIGLSLSIVADVACTPLSKWADVNVFRDSKTDSAAPIRAGTFSKMFPEIGDLVEVAHACCNGYMMRSMPRNSGCKFEDLSQNHGFSNAVDTSNWKRAHQAKTKIFQALKTELKDQLRLLDHLWPVAYNITIENSIYSMPIGGFITAVDQLGEKVFNVERSTDVLIPYDQQVVKETLR